ncbi:hypothetical protein IAD21_04561 [Abditibacteriota bacterium]|nr:hypothetical protein IAD21_04561 [Abditibacteriota bacterium]
MKRSPGVRLALTFALLAPLAVMVATARQSAADDPEKIVTEAENGSNITLNADEVLIVRLKENPSTGYS